jgi:hypothetical protein
MLTVCYLCWDAGYVARMCGIKPNRRNEYRTAGNTDAGRKAGCLAESKQYKQINLEV